MVKKIICLLYCVVLILPVTIYSQTEQDSITTSIDSLLNQEVEQPKYVNSASKYYQSEQEAPSSINIITSKEIEEYGYHSLAELLNDQKGMYISNDRVTSYLGVRGFSRLSDNNNRILLLIDGHRMNGYQVDGAPIGNSVGLNLSNFQRVEIVRGPSSALYGTNALFTVINLVSKTPELSTSSITTRYGSFNRREIGIQIGNRFNNIFDFSILGNYFKSNGANYYYSEFDTPGNNNGLSINKDADEYYGILTTINFKTLNFRSMYMSRKKFIPTASYNTDFTKQQFVSNSKFWAELNWKYDFSYDKQLAIKLSYDFDDYSAEFPFFFGNLIVNGLSKTLGINGQYIWDLLPNNRLIIGSEYKKSVESGYRYGTKTYDLVNAEWPYEIFSVYLQNEYQLNQNLSIYFGFRWDNYINEDNYFSPRAAMVYSLNSTNVFKFIYGNSFRAPNIIEKNLEEKTIVGYKKNLNLNSENINTLELIWEHEYSKTFSSILSLYHYKLNNIIEQVKDTTDGLIQYQNFSGAKTDGVEFELNGKFNFGFKSYLRYSYQKALDNNQKELTNSPENLLKIGFRKDLFNKVNFALEFRYESPRLGIDNEETKPIYLIDINFIAKPIFNHLTMSLKINNVLNRPLSYPGGNENIQRNIKQPGRNLLFTLKYEF
ncbi:vitamin B12 transporter BtuB precursor [bacterium BMS3Abin04]|nr:vitamin B12 transporter BtuB precursor [bacterium BMS3Abin04]